MSAPNWLSSLNLPYEEPANSGLDTADDAEWVNSLGQWTTFDLDFAPQGDAAGTSAPFSAPKNQLEQQQYSGKVFENVFTPQHQPHAPLSSYANLGTAIDGSNLVFDPAYQPFSVQEAPARQTQSHLDPTRSAADSRPSSLDKKSAVAHAGNATRHSQRSSDKLLGKQQPESAAPAVTVSPLNPAVTISGEPHSLSASGPSPAYETTSSLHTQTASPVSSTASPAAPAPKPRGGQNKKVKLPKNADQLDPEELASRMALEEDKRRRNTAASARFRVKKKEREAAVAEQNKDLVVKVKELESQVSSLQEENTWLKELVQQQHGSLPVRGDGRGTKRNATEAAL